MNFSDHNSMFCVMYHYIRESEKSKLKCLDRADFIQQLDFLEETYGVVKREQYDDILNGKYFGGAILTFDDGLKEHYSRVSDILEERGYLGIFFINTNPQANNLPCSVHLLHFLLANYSHEEIQSADSYMEISNEIKATKRMDFSSQWSVIGADEFTKELKTFFNYRKNSDSEAKICNLFFELTQSSVSQFSREWYLNESEIVSLHNRGFVIGCHTVSHPLLSEVSKEELEREISESTIYLNTILGKTCEVFSYPFGGKESYSEDAIKSLESLDYKLGFSVSDELMDRDYFKRRFEIPRINCNRLPFGASRSSC